MKNRPNHRIAWVDGAEVSLHEFTQELRRRGHTATAALIDELAEWRAWWERNQAQPDPLHASPAVSGEPAKPAGAEPRPELSELEYWQHYARWTASAVELATLRAYVAAGSVASSVVRLRIAELARFMSA